MMPEILQVSVPPHLMADKPASYTDFSNHVVQVKHDQELAKEKKDKGESHTGGKHTGRGRHKKGKREQGMDVGQTNVGENEKPGHVEEEGMETSTEKTHKKRNRRRNKGQGMEVIEGEEENGQSMEHLQTDNKENGANAT